VLEISFQLSFAAVLAILLGMPRVTARLDEWEEERLIRLRDPRWAYFRRAVLYAAVTVCATAGTSPLAVLHFNSLSLIAPAANLVLLPLLGLVPVGLGLLGAMAAPFTGRAADVLFGLAARVISLGDAGVAALAALPFAAVRIPTPTLAELAAVYVALTALLLPGVWRRRLLAACLAFAVVDASCWYVARFHRPNLRLTFLSVGQGDSTLIEFPGSQTMLVDAGGMSTTFDVGERVIAPYLWRRRIARLDLAVLSHFDFDHHGGFPFLVGQFVPRELWSNGWRGSHDDVVALRAVAGSVGTRIRAPRPGFRRVVGGVEVVVLAGGDADRGKENDRSLVVQLRYGQTRILLPGDVEAAGEERLLGKVAAELRSAILKVPHHGSKTSSTPAFLDAVAPRFAIVSVGYDNRFGMPHRKVIEAYEEIGAEVLRTDRDGALVLEIEEDGGISVARTMDGSA
jgi:competence protein ComEC